MQKLTALEWLALTLVVVGALNWGLVGLFEFNLVDAIFGEMSALSRVVYAVVGVAGVYLAAVSPRLARR